MMFVMLLIEVSRMSLPSHKFVGRLTTKLRIAGKYQEFRKRRARQG